MIKSVYEPGKKLRVVGVCSGPGQAFWSAFDYQDTLEASSGSCPFEMVGLFSDRPASAALAEADRRGLPTYLLDAGDFHHGPAGQLMSVEDNLAFEKAMVELLAPIEADCLLVSGYQWTIGSRLLGKYLAVRLWPGGPACVKAFLKTGDKNLRAKATLLTAPGGLGPVMIVAPPVVIEQDQFEDEKSGLLLYLPPAMEQSGRAGTEALVQLGRGNFGLDEANTLYYQGKALPEGLIFDHW